MPIDGRKSHSSIVAELIDEYKTSGKIGNTTPKNMEHAQKIANAIAYDKKGTGNQSINEALKTYIINLIRPENKTFIEGVVLKGLKVCFESDQAIINLDGTDGEEGSIEITSDDDGINEEHKNVQFDPDALTQQENDALKIQMDQTQASKDELNKKATELTDQAKEYEENADKLRNAAAAVSIEQ